MKLTILGNNGPFPGAGGACSGYLLSSESTRILIECGTGTLANLTRHIHFDDLDAIVLSHLHFDHMSDALPMQYVLQFHPHEGGLMLLAPKTPEKVRALLDAPCYKLMDMQDTQIGDIRLSFMPVRHPVETYAIRAECNGRVFGYTGDTNTLPCLEAFLKDADVLLADAGLSSEHWKEAAPHLSARHCAELAAAANAKKLLLTHLNPRYTPELLESEAREIYPEVHFVRIGESFDI